ncbi:MAG: hypothetical protein LC437_08720 [Thiohalomonas sp.]|nr:hypothetical protein [Thiohalomonas sp.]
MGIHTNKTAIGRSKNRRADVQLFTTAPPTAEERKAIEAERKAERRRQLTERSIFNPPSSTETKPEIDKKQEQNDSATKIKESEAIENIHQALPDSADYDEPPAPNFINFDHLVDKHNQKVKSR